MILIRKEEREREGKEVVFPFSFFLPFLRERQRGREVERREGRPRERER